MIANIRIKFKTGMNEYQHTPSKDAFLAKLKNASPCNRYIAIVKTLTATTISFPLKYMLTKNNTSSKSTTPTMT